MIKEFNKDERQKDQLEDIQIDFEEKMKEAQRDNFEIKKRENRMLMNMDDVWEKIRHEMQIIVES